MDEIILILLILAAIWYWWDTQKSNEVALAVCRQKCENNHLQLLDATVIRQKTWLRRGTGGFIQICRLYSFDYSRSQSEGFETLHFSDREYGYIVLIDKQVIETRFDNQR